MRHQWKISSLLVMTMVLFPFNPTRAIVQDETNKMIVAALTAGDAVALSDFFNTMVDLSLSGNEDSYSKTQATQILKDFFLKNPVKSFKVTQQGSSTDGNQFTIGEMKAGTDTFRVCYLLKKVSGKLLIQQLQIQKVS
jgi:hypothetical protein